MTPEHWKKVKVIVEEALEVAPAARSAHLKKICQGDEDLRREAESLLDFEHEESGMFEKTAFSALILENFGDAPSSFVGRQIGNYKILSELGAGGMGMVFLAERADGAFEQKVALKLIKRGMDSSAILRRFLNERQILASLKHPNIAHLIDGGTTDDGLPFFVMESVEGETILDYARQMDLDLEERLQLFRQACSAVSFAHRNLVIHRDLKPSNILVTKDGVPKLLDFGIAKLLKIEGKENTSTQSFVFTPEYASPEQVRGEKLTTATDVYSLGVILYELLTGTRPIKSDPKNISDIIRAVCETEPERPSSVQNSKFKVQSSKSENETSAGVQQQTNETVPETNHKAHTPNPKSLRGDLDNIILKALRKEPERRYTSVEQFSEDIRRHLEGLPVAASRDTWSYRASKFIQRNRLGVAAAALILLVLMSGLGATLYQANVARRERAKAEQRFNDVRQLANSFMFEFHDAIKDLSGSTEAQKLIVSRAIEYLDKLAAESETDATLQRELATAYAKIGQIQGNSYHSNLGDSEGAMKSYRRSLEIRQRLAGADPNNLDLQHELADSFEGVGDMLYTVNDLQGGLQSYESGVGILEKTVAAQPGNLEYRYSLAGILGKRGDISGMEGFPNLGDVPKALESYRRAVALYEELVKDAPENEKYKNGYATSLHYFGMLQTTTGDAKGAIANGEKALSIFESLIAAHPDNAKYETHLMSALVFMRYPLLEEGRNDQAVKNARRVVQTMEKMSAEDPKNAFMKRSLSVSYNSLGICLLQAGDAKSAMESHHRSLALIEELYKADSTSGENSRDLSLTRQFLAEAQIAAGETEAALANLKSSVSFLEAQIKKEDSSLQTKEDLAICLTLVGKILVNKADLKGAADAFRSAIPLVEESLQKALFNVRVKVRQANALFEAGKAITKLAQIEAGEKRGAIKSEACNYLKRSFDIWNEMRQTETLSAINANRPDEVSRELSATCQ